MAIKSKKNFFCEPLLETAKASDVFRMVNKFFVKQNFDWKKKLGSICTDGAPAMLGNKSGFAALVKNEVPNVNVTHCMLHRYALAAKTLPPSLKEVLSVCVKVVNFVRSRAINHVSSKFSVRILDQITLCFCIIQKYVGFPEAKF